jgi:2-dehydro-3-deoxygluconokinase
VLARDGTPEQIAAGLAEEFDHETVVLTRGAEGALAWEAGETVEQAAFDADTHDAVGSGDAFVGGFLVACGDGKPLSEALAWGAASASLKRTIAGDVAVISRDDVETVLSDASGIDR